MEAVAVAGQFLGAVDAYSALESANVAVERKFSLVGLIEKDRVPQHAAVVVGGVETVVAGEVVGIAEERIAAGVGVVGVGFAVIFAEAGLAEVQYSVAAEPVDHAETRLQWAQMQSLHCRRILVTFPMP